MQLERRGILQIIVWEIINDNVMYGRKAIIFTNILWLFTIFFDASPYSTVRNATRGQSPGNDEVFGSFHIKVCNHMCI